MPWRTLFCSALLVGTIASTTRADPPAAEFRNGQWQPIVAPAPPPPPPRDPILDHAQQLIDTGHPADAKKLDVAWIKSHSKTAPLRDVVIFQLAQEEFVIDGFNDRIKSFYYCDELMDEYPNSPRFNPALALQYEIADTFLNGHRMPFLGIRIVSAYDEAVEMLYRIQQRSPGSPLAEKALLRTADYYYSDRDYDLAHDAYARYVKDYPRSDHVPTVRLREAFASLAQFRGVRFDPSMILDARAQLLDLIAAYPDLAREENLAALVRAIDDTLSEKLFVTADFYRRTNLPSSAVYLYRYLLQVYPSSPQASGARQALNKMPQWALNQPPPTIETADLPRQPMQ